MARTKAEIRAFLDSLVGTKPINKPDRDYDGQCVTLIKVLLEFLGAPNPYAARGNAIDVDDTLLRQGIANDGKGWLTIVVNKDMGRIYENGRWNNYGHIWVDLQGEANYESNGAKALYTTKNTRPITQGQQFVNLDKYIAGEEYVMNDEDAKEVYRAVLHREPENDNVWRAWVGKPYRQAAIAFKNSKEWLTQNHAIVFFAQREQQLNEARDQLAKANDALKVALDNDATDKKAIADAQKQAQDALDNLNVVTDKFNKVNEQLEAAKKEQVKADETGNAFLRWLGQQLNKLIGGK